MWGLYRPAAPTLSTPYTLINRGTSATVPKGSFDRGRRTHSVHLGSLSVTACKEYRLAVPSPVSLEAWQQLQIAR